MGFIKNVYSVLILICFITTGVSSQQTKLNGKITAINGVVIEKAEVLVKNKQRSTYSDDSGLFTIECRLKDKLIVKASGFKTKTIKVKNIIDTLNIDLVLNGDESNLELAATAGHLKGDNLILAQKYYEEKNNFGFGYTNVIDLIKGKFPQISYVNNEFIMRGNNFVATNNGSKNGAVIVINGVVSDVSVLQSIIVSNIKNIKILTGSEATRFGMGSGNGVISVSLKQN
ncbi:carboxypeptidase-like regulatory domain-containing protein [Maribacter sp. HTCC2170]|uniref:carboxypeptidase-like regulatory domain-containing protein n=1 Tax=Maribacter sp. (strain HTCC2170 / KCCM 42371) TaxID=313603 RepID=UPI00006BD510|nr:carboxypeptidase-like regulatory domain-containing protein [Maribacter sp. HTCC2170]EAR02816.1 hypothetical protein FB2170_05995 [Maribacter sp. HTCC2170]